MAVELILQFLFYGALGLSIGSFINACMDRLPLQFLSDKERQDILSNSNLSDVLKSYICDQNFNISSPRRSLCFACGEILSWYENLPVLSYLLQQGQCRHCGIRYGKRAIYIELSHALIYAVGFTKFGLSALSIALSLFYSLGILYTVIYFESQKQPSYLHRFYILISVIVSGILVVAFY